MAFTLRRDTCLIDLDNAKIYYRGYELGEFALKSTFK
ncbi:citrate/2-methylcitrate synthase [Vulcanisaeta sp. JCM 14467]|nr:citrate/2-methylcitrate synthase [Vulcanisaeta sp. JCM 14467]